MEYFSTKKIGRTFVLRLDQGEYVLESINNLISKENINNGVVTSAIGTFDRCIMHMVTTIGYPPEEYFDKYEDKALELAAIQGFIANGVPHLHMVISDTEKAYAGHLEEGCRVLYLAEIVIQELLDLNVHRVRDDKNILKLKDKQFE